MPPSAIWDLFWESFSFRSYLHEREARVQIIGKKMTSKINLILLERHALIDLSHENENESQQKWLGICMFLSEFGSNYLLSWWTVSVVKIRAMSAGWPILLPIVGIVGIVGISYNTISSHVYTTATSTRQQQKQTGKRIEMKRLLVIITNFLPKLTCNRLMTRQWF